MTKKTLLRQKVYFTTIGRIGGKRKSAKKTAATRRNMAKARAARWPKKKGGGK